MSLSFKRVVALLLLAVFLFGLLPSLPKAYAADGQDEQYDPLHTMLALNMAIVSIHRIITTQDRIVLNQEYDNIINKLALGNIESDYDITGLYSELMNFITGRLIRQEDMKRVQARYNRREQQQIVEAVSGVRAYGGNFWSWLGSLAVSCVSQYFSYQSAKENLHEELDEEVWLLKKDDIEQCNELQVKLLNSSWNLLRQYRLPDEYRLTQDSLDGLYSALNEPDPARRLRRLQVRTIERNFQAYPPYWFYRARAAQELNQGEEAAKCYAKFNEIWRPVLRRDPYKLETEKYAVLTLAKDPEVNKDEIKKHLAAIQENLADDDWSNNLFAGVVYFLLGGKNDRAEAVRLLEDNVIAGLETDVSGVILRQMEAGRLNPESLPNELKNIFKAFEEREKLIAQAEYWKKAAEQGHADAQFNLGVMYQNGQGVEQDYKKAVEWYRKAAEQGHARAQNNLGFMYAGGRGVEQDYKKAFEWCQKAAEQGHAGAQFNLGAMYYAGRGVEQDHKKAVELWKKAAEQGHAGAQFFWGAMYYTGQGVEQDYKKAVEWYRKAAEQGHADAQCILGVAYEYGEGVTKDLRKAREWYQKAANQGDEDAKKALERLR